MASSAETVTKGIMLLWVYSLGLAVPFLVTSLLIGRFLKFYGRFRRHLHTLEVCSGVFLVVFGVLILTRHFAVLSSYLGFLNRFTL
jgi:cytochrome c-type biogenesis protein